MLYAQFYKLSTGYIAGTIPPQFSEENRKPIPACGSDGVMILDARYNKANLSVMAASVARKNGFIGYTLHKGESFTRSAQISDYCEV